MKVYEIKVSYVTRDYSWLQDLLYEDLDNYSESDINENECNLNMESGCFCYGMYASKELARKVISNINLGSLSKKKHSIKDIVTRIAQYKKWFDIGVFSELIENGDAMCITVRNNSFKFVFDLSQIRCDIIEKEVEEDI